MLCMGSGCVGESGENGLSPLSSVGETITIGVVTVALDTVSATISFRTGLRVIVAHLTNIVSCNYRKQPACRYLSLRGSECLAVPISDVRHLQSCSKSIWVEGNRNLMKTACLSRCGLASQVRSANLPLMTPCVPSLRLARRRCRRRLRLLCCRRHVR